MDSAEKLTKRQPRRDRVALDPVSITRLNAWIDQLTKDNRGLKVNRAALVNFLVQSHATELSSKEVSDLNALHFDEIEYATWALNELKKARGNGQKVSLDEILSLTGERRAPRPRKRKMQKPEAITDGEGGSNGAPNR